MKFIVALPELCKGTRSNFIQSGHKSYDHRAVLCQAAFSQHTLRVRLETNHSHPHTQSQIRDETRTHMLRV